MYLYDGRHWLIVDGRLPMHCNLFIEKLLTIRIDTNLSKQMLNFTLTKRWAIPEKIQTGRGLRTYFYEEIPGNFMFVTLPLEIP